jgi:hypothetical protein
VTQPVNPVLTQMRQQSLRKHFATLPLYAELRHRTLPLILSPLRSLFSRHLVCLLLTMLVAPASADALLRNLEIAQCADGELATWGDGQDRMAAAGAFTFSYRHAGAPSWFKEQQVLSLLQKSAAEWSRCGIPAQVMVAAPSLQSSRGNIIVQWDAAGSGGHFGLANLGNHQLSLGAQAFHLLNQRNPAHNALDTLQMVLSHEMGHFYGLMAHSRRCVDVLSYYHDGKGGQCFTRNPGLLKAFPEYRSSLPTACDIQRCRVLNRIP